ncbi:LAME_0F07514g1_1 [Lachancea meyersii CBS 8951]|uniref:LAME_0F07514g1_1 n=1 Tax=Lachancea meyersii CBS 8951 TaxID=1266667 RepID=A0A1G4JUA7_9SACH|nr:LAME_0F07514g1_1 [Lachancea meyersii CBS 8951]
MPRIKLFDVAAFALVGFVGIYTGTQFFEPIVIDRLRKDGHLRTDVEIPQYDEEGNPLSPKSMLDLKGEMDKIQQLQQQLQQQQQQQQQQSATQTNSLK